MTNSQSGALRMNPEYRVVMEYLNSHGPSTSAQMRADGLEIHRGTLMRMSRFGLVTSKRKAEGNVRVWGIM